MAVGCGGPDTHTEEEIVGCLRGLPADIIDALDLPMEVIVQNPHPHQAT